METEKPLTVTTKEFGKAADKPAETVAPEVVDCPDYNDEIGDVENEVENENRTPQAGGDPDLNIQDDGDEIDPVENENLTLPDGEDQDSNMQDETNEIDAVDNDMEDENGTPQDGEDLNSNMQPEADEIDRVENGMNEKGTPQKEEDLNSNIQPEDEEETSKSKTASNDQAGDDNADPNDNPALQKDDSKCASYDPTKFMKQADQTGKVLLQKLSGGPAQNSTNAPAQRKAQTRRSVVPQKSEPPKQQPQQKPQPELNVVPPNSQSQKRQQPPQQKPRPEESVVPLKSQPQKKQQQQQPQQKPQPKESVVPPRSQAQKQPEQPQQNPQPEESVVPPKTQPQQQRQQQDSQPRQSFASREPKPEARAQQEQRQRECGSVNVEVGGDQQVPSRTQSGGAVHLPTPEEDAISLHRAFTGSGCDISRIVEILSKRDAAHCLLIRQHYQRTYGEDLAERLSSELSSFRKGDLKEKLGVDITLNATGRLGMKFSSDIKKAVSLWILTEAERDATIVWQGLTVTSLDLEAVTEVICSRTPSQLLSLKQAYFSRYGSELQQDIRSCTFLLFGYHKELLLSCLDEKARDDGTNVDEKLAEEDAKQLYKDGEQIWGTNKKTFIDIFTKRNRPHLAAVDAAYNKFYRHSLEKAVVGETSGDFGNGLLILLKCAKNPAKYFAEVLYNAMKGVVTSDTRLTRAVALVTRADVHMEEIKQEYYNACNISLIDAVHKNASGLYRTFLLNLLE